MAANNVLVTEYQVFEVIVGESALCRTKPPEYAKCFRQFRDTQGVQDNKDISDFFLNAWNHFKRLKKKRLANSDILAQASKVEVEMEGHRPQPPVAEKKQRKSFVNLGERMRKERTQGLLDYIQEYTAKECPELSVTQLLGYLIHRVNIQSEKKTARVGYELFSSNVNDIHSFEVNEAVALMHSLTLSRDQMRKMRHILAAKGIYFPTSNELLEGRKKLRPTISPVLDERGVQVQYKDLVKMTIESIISLIPTKILEDKCKGVLEMVFKDGGDGAGQQVVWNSTSMLDATENIFQYGITPLKLVARYQDGSSFCLWQNHSPNNCRTLRPLFLIREKETDEDLLNLVIPITDKAREELCSDGICATVNGQGYDVNVIIHDSMKDLKFKRYISGLGGADCILCTTKQADWTDRTKVADGFPINRSAKNSLELYNELVDENGDIKAKQGDFETRKGLTKKPLTTSDQSNITVTHSYINGTTWFLKVLYRCHADYQQWIEKSDVRGEPVRRAKDRVLEAIYTETGLYLDRVNTAGGKGGTSTNGPQGRRFFSEEVLASIEKLVDEKHRENLLLLHRQLSTVLSVVSSSRKIDLMKFKELCEQTSFHLCDNFPWVMMNHTLHGTLHHSTELMSLNDGHGLGSLSEECLESNNKDIRNYLQFLSRKTDPLLQLTDVMARLLERSDPIIQDITINFQPRKFCTECGAEDHTIRSHGRLVGQPKQWYASLVEDILLD